MKKKFLTRAGSIILTGILSYCAILWFAISLGLTHWIPNFYSNAGGVGQLLLRMREIRNVENVDVLFIGSSHAYRGFDPREFKREGITAFNLGSTSQTPFNSYYMLKNHLHSTNPEVVVLDLYWDMLVQDGLESTIDIVSNTALENEIFEMVADSKNTLAFNSMLISIIQRLHTPLDFVEQKTNQEDIYVAGGFTQTLLSENIMSEEKLDKLGPMVVEFSNKQLSYLNKIAALCKQRGVKLVFVVVPVTKEYRNKVVNYKEYAATLQHIAAQHGVLFFDYNSRDELELHTRYDFYDQDHLTQQGVKKFNDLLIRDFKEHEILPYRFAEAETN